VIREWKHAPWLAVAAVGLGALMSQVDASIVTLAYPTLQRHFGVSLGAATWVGLAYLLTVVATLVAFGRISDMVGRKLIYVYGFGIFLLGSLLCGIAPSFDVLVLSRVVQAVGGSMLQANSVAIVVLALPVASRTKGLGIQAGAQALGLALGPTLGGLLLGVASWRWLFLVNIPIGIVALIAAVIFIPRSQSLAKLQRLDWLGILLLMVAVSTLLGSLSFAYSLGWSSLGIVGGFVVSGLSGAWFVRHELRHPEPLLDPSLLRSTVVRRGLVAATISYVALFALMLTVPFAIERGLDRGPAYAGLVLLALPLAIGVSAPFAGRVAQLLGRRLAAALAGVIGGAGIVLAGVEVIHASLMVVGLGIAGVGFGVFNTLNNANVMSAIPDEQTAVGSAMLNTTRGLGTALGLAVGGALFVGLGGSSIYDATVRDAFAWTALIMGAAMGVAGFFGATAEGELRHSPTPAGIST